MSKLMKLAEQFTKKLGLKTSEKIELPKSLRKIAQAEQKLNTKLAKQKEKFLKIASGPCVQWSGEPLPAIYSICTACQGEGKVAIHSDNVNVKFASLASFASTEEYLNHFIVEKCANCKGKRVLKNVDSSQCSEEQLLAFAAEKTDKKEEKQKKKEEKKAAKLAKLETKAKEKKLAIDDPEAHAKLKADKKVAKNKEKAKKAADKAAKKLAKAKAK